MVARRLEAMRDDMGVSVNSYMVPYFGVLIIRILLFRVLYWGFLFSETSICPAWSTYMFQ